jgi:hypothetical protein
MKIRHNLTLTVLATKQEPSKDGDKTYKRLAVLTLDNEAGMLPCSDDIYNMVVESKVQLPAQYDLVTIYDDKYNYYRVEAMFPHKK